MPYKVFYNDGDTDHDVGNYDDFPTAYKAAHAAFPEMTSATSGNRWHVILYDYAKKLMGNTNTGTPLKVAYQHSSPNPEDEVISLYIIIV